MTRRRILFLLWFTFCLLVGTVAGIALTTTEYSNLPGINNTWLPGHCQITTYTNPAYHPYQAMTLSCPSADTIRLWPWPPTQLWLEDWIIPKDPMNLDA